MARKKSSSNDFEEAPDETEVEAEVLDSDGGTAEGSPRVNIAPEKPAKDEPTLSDTTKAEQETGRKTVEERSKSKAAETGEEPA